MNILEKLITNDFSQNALDARREILEDRGVLCVRRSNEEIEATQQTGYFQRNQT
ncbi:MAG: hypothetical protein JRJ43_08055 [Deltaproteobacteria bacterium]|nr:hypothetical protein [Deltaproteobacteria bacterium]MBW1939593.1 hypothetical protein [Deltaproteobacteria bacterium]MBW1965111.1 hypothetical protein [Deltaproteobacteria bacterium]MBW2081455.1 hypothetical protein [Deltaproteobacteria bacterium]MBW2350701.1 hypothetical protein [Deltaproteobacteria bacterium]